MAAEIRITGLRETRASLDLLGQDIGDLAHSLTRAGDLVAREARGLARKRSGRMADSITAVGRRTRAVVRAGGPGIPYAGVQHYGGYHGITPNPFLTDALTREQGAVVREIRTELTQLIRRRGLT